MFDVGTKAHCWISKPETWRQEGQAQWPARYLVLGRSHQGSAEGLDMALGGEEW